MKKRIFSLFLALILVTGSLSGCQAKPDATGRYKLSRQGEAIIDDVTFSSDYRTDDNARVYYEIFVGSFSDSDGDGIGDLQGIIDRMDYLNDGDPTSGRSLGVEGLWLTPIFPSHSYHKYDSNDYYDIDPAFGDLDTFKKLLKICHERNVQVIIDLAINHTGTGAPWYSKFVNAHRQGLTDDPYYNFYSWYPGSSQAPAGRTFSQISGTNDYYECNFSGSMPELNYDEPLVRETVVDIAKFWLDLGVDGFRFDAIKYIYFGDHQASSDFWMWYTSELRKMKPDIYLVGECWDSDGVTDLYYPALNCFDFSMSQVNGKIAETAKTGDVNLYCKYTSSYIERVRQMRSDAMMLPFITNHDMDRAAGFLTCASFQMQMAANLYLLSPGSPFIYYGEEIGMRGSRGGSNTDANRRLHMLWGDDDTISDPEGSTYPDSNQTEDTVMTLMGNGDSILNYYKRLIMIRNANPEIARGFYTPLSFSDKASGFISTWNGSSVVVLHNTTAREIRLDLSAAGCGFVSEIAAMIGRPGSNCTLEGSILTIGPQMSAVLR